MGCCARIWSSRVGRVLNELLHEHVDSFNAGVRTGDWSSMLERFDDAAEMEFRGIPVGPFHGKQAIAEAYRAQPPDDELRLLDERERDGAVEARYAWLAEPDVAAGELLLTVEQGRIRRLVITFDRGVAWS
jgi:steroid Delta-isomerase